MWSWCILISTRWATWHFLLVSLMRHFLIYIIKIFPTVCATKEDGTLIITSKLLILIIPFSLVWPMNKWIWVNMSTYEGSVVLILMTFLSINFIRTLESDKTRTIILAVCIIFNIVKIIHMVIMTEPSEQINYSLC